MPIPTRFFLSLVALSAAFPAAAQDTASPSPAQIAPEAPATSAPSEVAPPAVASLPAVASAYDRGVEAFVKGDFQGARALFSEALQTPASSDEASRARVLHELSQRYMSTGARLIFPSGNAKAQGGLPANLPDERTDDEIVSYYLMSIPYGVALGAYATQLMETTSPAGYFFPILGGIGLSAGAMAYADTKQTRSYGEPQAIVSGGLIGLQIGIPIIALAKIGGTESLGIGLVSVTAGAAAGFFANHTWGTTPGEMSFVGSAALWSNVLGVLGSAAANGANTNWDKMAAVSLAAVAVGTAGGAAFARQVSPSIARVRYIDFGAIVGGIAFGGTYAALAGSDASDSSVRAITLITGTGVLAGAGLAGMLTSGMRRDETRRPGAATWSPSVAPTAGGFTAGVGGTF